MDTLCMDCSKRPVVYATRGLCRNCYTKARFAENEARGLLPMCDTCGKRRSKTMNGRKECGVCQVKRWNSDPVNRETTRKRHRDRHNSTPPYAKHGVSDEQWLEMIRRGCNACGSAGGKRGLMVDHDHACCPGDRSCGKCVRGALCANCNSAEGLLRGDYKRIMQLANYVLQFEASNPASRDPWEQFGHVMMAESLRRTLAREPLELEA